MHQYFSILQNLIFKVTILKANSESYFKLLIPHKLESLVYFVNGAWAFLAMAPKVSQMFLVIVVLGGHCGGCESVLVDPL